MSEVSDSLAENAVAPRKASNATGSMEQHSLKDQIAADRYINSKAAARTSGLGIKLVNLTHGEPV